MSDLLPIPAQDELAKLTHAEKILRLKQLTKAVNWLALVIARECERRDCTDCGECGRPSVAEKCD